MNGSAPLPGWPHAASPFSPVEQALQEKFGHRAQLDLGARRGVRAVLIEQHRTFYAQLPFLLVGSVDAEGQPWASMLAARPGFVSSPDPSTLRVDVRPVRGDPLGGNLRLGAPMAVLGIEPPTRRRNRMNGRLAADDAGGFSIGVVQSYGNCPQYIQGRALDWVAPSKVRVHRSDHLSPADRALLEAADTFYIASANPQPEDGLASGADVSHRGGRPGFIRVDDPQTLTTPDFVGNYFFNTLGNLMVEPRAGLLFADFARGDLLLAAAEAEIIWAGPEVEAFAGAQRLVRFHLTQVIRLEGALPFRVHPGAVDFAPELPATGTWAEADQALAAKAAATTWRPFRIAEVVQESDSVRSFILEPADGLGVAAHRPGQFLPIRILPEVGAPPVVRTYTLSDVSDGRRYRISVKRDGVASRWLHDQAHVGAVIEALAPNGEFVFQEDTNRPVLLLSAGIGVTPMVAMLNSILVNDMRTRRAAPILFLHGARSGRDQAFAAHVRHKAAHHGNLKAHIALSAPGPEDRLGETYDSEGRIDADLLARLLPTTDIDAYLCGPPAFAQAQYDALRALGVPDAQIHAEAFGPSSLARSGQTSPEDEVAGPAVAFVASGKRIDWRPSYGSLLAAAQAAGAPALYSCKSGVCGTCAVRLLAGAVTYTLPPVADRAPDEVLICCSRPADDHELRLDL